MSSLPVPASRMYPAMPAPDGAAPYAAKGPSSGTFDLRFIGGILRRRWRLLSSTVIGITAAAVPGSWSRSRSIPPPPRS